MFIEGRVAEMFGVAALPSDLEMRNIGFMEMAINNKKHTDPQTTEYLQAYADGINEYARESKMLPFEFYLFWLPWEDWIIEDSLATINLLSFTLEFDWFYEIARQRLLETVGFDLGVKTITYGGSNLFRNVSIINDEELKEMGKYKEYDFKRQT
jgi:penicillin G amidase